MSLCEVHTSVCTSVCLYVPLYSPLSVRLPWLLLPLQMHKNSWQFHANFFHSFPGNFVATFFNFYFACILLFLAYFLQLRTKTSSSLGEIYALGRHSMGLPCLSLSLSVLSVRPSVCPSVRLSFPYTITNIYKCWNTLKTETVGKNNKSQRHIAVRQRGPTNLSAKENAQRKKRRRQKQKATTITMGDRCCITQTTLRNSWKRVWFLASFPWVLLVFLLFFMCPWRPLAWAFGNLIWTPATFFFMFLN